MIEVFDK